MNITDKTLDTWKRFLAFSISLEESSVLASIPIRLRDTEETKVYPGIYLAEAGRDRMEAGGVKDGNAWRIEIQTQLVTTPGEDEQDATSKAAHDILRNALDKHIDGCKAQSWMDSKLGIVVWQVLDSAPETTDQEGYRVTGWVNDMAVCLD